MPARFEVLLRSCAAHKCARCCCCAYALFARAPAARVGPGRAADTCTECSSMISSFRAIDGCASASTTHDGVSDKLNTIQVFVGVVGGPLRATRVPSDVTPRDLAAFLHFADGFADRDLRAISGTGRVLPLDTPLGTACKVRDPTVRFTGRLRGGADGGGGAAAATPVADDIAKAKARAEGHRARADAASVRASDVTDPVIKEGHRIAQYENLHKAPRCVHKVMRACLCLCATFAQALRCTSYGCDEVLMLCCSTWCLFRPRRRLQTIRQAVVGSPRLHSR